MILVAQGVVFAVFLAAAEAAGCLVVLGDADYLVAVAAACSVVVVPVAVVVEVVMVDPLHRVLTRRLSAVHVR